MNQVSSYQAKLIALQFATENEAGDLLEEAEKIYQWLKEELEFEEAAGNVPHLQPVN